MCASHQSSVADVASVALLCCDNYCHVSCGQNGTEPKYIIWQNEPLIIYKCIFVDMTYKKKLLKKWIFQRFVYGIATNIVL